MRGEASKRTFSDASIDRIEVGQLRKSLEVSKRRAPEQSVADYSTDEVQLLGGNAKGVSQQLGDISLRWS